MPRGNLFPLAAIALLSLSCGDLDHFSNGPGDAYCGAITLGSTFRTGLSPRVQMRLRLDASQLTGPGSPGTLSTFEARDGDRPPRRLLHEAPLQRIPALENDPLSQLDLGEGRIRSAIFGVTPNERSLPGAEKAASILVVLSFLSDDRIEVRLLRPGPPQSGDEPVSEGERTLFGVFPLARQVGLCGF
ncbi:MAG: hypothetical protein U0359_33810 [Byssovorax sp.]